MGVNQYLSHRRKETNAVFHLSVPTQFSNPLDKGIWGLSGCKLELAKLSKSTHS